MTEVYTETAYGRVERRYAENHANIARLHAKKNADYGQRDVDPYANFRTAADVGVEPWRGAVVRMLDKVSRIKTYCADGSLENESFEDSLADLANYALIVQSLWQEATEPQGVCAYPNCTCNVLCPGTKRAPLASTLANCIDGCNDGCKLADPQLHTTNPSDEYQADPDVCTICGESAWGSVNTKWSKGCETELRCKAHMHVRKPGDTRPPYDSDDLYPVAHTAKCAPICLAGTAPQCIPISWSTNNTPRAWITPQNTKHEGCGCPLSMPPHESTP